MSRLRCIGGVGKLRLQLRWHLAHCWEDHAPIPRQNPPGQPRSYFWEFGENDFHGLQEFCRRSALGLENTDETFESIEKLAADSLLDFMQRPFPVDNTSLDEGLSSRAQIPRFRRAALFA